MVDLNGIFEHKEQATDRHVITTDHPYMADIGLNVFTTGTLQEWWDKDSNKDGNGDIKYFEVGFSIKKLLEGNDNHFFTAWDQKSRTWKKHEKVANHNDSNWKWENHNGGRNYGANDLSNWLDPNNHKSYAHLHQGKPHDPADDVTQTNLGNLIEMNNWYVNYSTDFPDESAAVEWGPDNRAASQFIRGTKASLNNEGVMWSGLISFDFSRLGLNVKTDCQKKEWVIFHLQLFDNKNPKKRKRMAALDLSQLNLVGSPIDSLGIEYRTGSRRDGEYDPAATNNNPAAREGGGLDLTKNELTGKWESGTPQIMAMLETDIPAASNDNNTYPSVTDLQSLENTEILTTTSNAYFNPGTGLAMPIIMQNANPLQWSPQYKEPRGCREGNKKMSVPVVNISNVPFESGSIVILSRINGAWVPVGFGEKPGAAPKASVFEGKWQFTYLMTSYNYFFRKPGIVNGQHVGEQVSWGEAYEKNFWWDYYWDPKYSDNSHSGEDVFVEDGNNNKLTDLFEVGGSKKGFYQTTSWDFMGKEIGGVRSMTDTLGDNAQFYITGHSIAGTQAAFDTDMKPLAKGDTTGTHHAPFWGCVFPGGYTTNKVAQYSNTDPTDGYKILGEESNNGPAGNFFSNSDTAISPDKFFDPDNDNNTGEGSPVGMFGGKQKSKLYHLPADIGTNASPYNSTNDGRPIVNQERINKHLTLSNDGTGSNHKESEDYFEGGWHRYAWMWQNKNAEGVEDFGGPFGPEISAFDLAPTDPKIIQFRPLRAETYASFDIKNDAQANVYLGTDKRGNFGARAWKFVDDGFAPVSWNVLNRDPDHGLHNNFVATNIPGFDPPSLESSLEHGQYDISLPGIFNDNMPHPYWNGTPYGGEGAGAYGIIGAVCTLQTAGDITITTEPSLGMAPWFFNVWGSSWTAGDLPTSPQTSIMYARVFSAWPRDLTVYDPRYFAVHHFNPGVGQTDNHFDGPDTQWYNGREAQGWYGAQNHMQNGPPTDAEYGYPNDWYEVLDFKNYGQYDFMIDRHDSDPAVAGPNRGSVDLTTPTVTSANDDGKGVWAKYNTAVYSDRVIGEDAAGNQFTNKQRMRAREHWNTSSTIRRGKLLPYFYKEHTIQLGWDEYANPIIPFFALLGETLTNDISVVILEGGSGYSEDDRFTTTYGSGKDLYLAPIITGGKITGFKVDENRVLTHLHDGTPITTPVSGRTWLRTGRGRDYSPGDFISYDKIHDGTDFLKVTTDTKSSLRIVPIQSEGEGLEAYFIRGTVQDEGWQVDEKPVLVQDATRLTQIPPRATVGRGGQAEQTLQILSSDKQTQIGTNGISPDSRYDIFFFFQNEISHTMSDQSLSFNATPKANEQYVNVSISFA